MQLLELLRFIEKFYPEHIISFNQRRNIKIALFYATFQLKNINTTPRNQKLCLHNTINPISSN